MSRDSVTRPKRRPRRRIVAGALAFLGLMGLGTGSASQLPLAGIVVSAGSAIVAPCQGSDPIRASFTTTWQGSNNRYRATAVQLTGINSACDGRSYTLVVLTTTGSGYRGPWIGTVASGTIASPAFTATPVAEIIRVELVIS